MKNRERDYLPLFLLQLCESRYLFLWGALTGTNARGRIDPGKVRPDGVVLFFPQDNDAFGAVGKVKLAGYQASELPWVL